MSDLQILNVKNDYTIKKKQNKQSKQTKILHKATLEGIDF